ncbi:hypothetical protein [Dactylosporangium sp. NPDC000521]|uniref:hypothetical protein n=1 Tax=Dactylosporangium sp. NPDC000521 TaxID=3363975 RepID=UPI00368AB305
MTASGTAGVEASPGVDRQPGGAPADGSLAIGAGGAVVAPPGWASADSHGLSSLMSARIQGVPLADGSGPVEEG